MNKLPKQPFYELSVVEGRNDGRSDGVACTILFAHVHGLVRYYVNYWMLNGHPYYVFEAYSWAGKQIWREVYTYDLPMCNVDIWAKHFPLSRLESALRQDLVRF